MEKNNYRLLSQKEIEALFTLAGISILNIKALPDGYSYSPEDSRYFEVFPKCVWWFVKTPAGWVEIGWRKRVISIDWIDTTIRKIITDDNVTKNLTYVHAWGRQKALEYLTSLAGAITENKTIHV